MRRLFAIVLILALLFLSTSVLVLALAIYSSRSGDEPVQQATIPPREQGRAAPNYVMKPPTGEQLDSPSAGETVPSLVADAPDADSSGARLEVTQQTPAGAGSADTAVPSADTSSSPPPPVPSRSVNAGAGRPEPARVTPRAKSEPARDNWISALPTAVTRTPYELANLASEELIGRLTITGDQFTNRSLRQLESLRVLSVSIEAVHVNNAGLIHLAQLSELKELRLWTPGVTDEGLAVLARLPDLQFLDLEGTSVRGPGLVHLKNLGQLRRLQLGPRSTDADLAVLTQLPHLEELDLRPCGQLTDAAIELLSRLASLRAVWLPAQVGTDGKLAVRRSLPRCDVNW